LSTGCGQKSVWGLPADELKDSLARADYSAFSGIDWKSQDLSQALELGPGAPYYLSLIFEKLKQPELSELMLELAWNRLPRPWKERAGLALVKRYLAEKDFQKAEKVARPLAEMVEGTPAAHDARRALVEALYWSKADEEVLSEARRIQPADAELSLFQAVSSLRLKRDAARSLFVDLFLREKLSPVHARAYLYLSADPESMGIFSDWEKGLLEGKFALQQGDWAKGIPLMEKAVLGIEPARLAGSPLISELGSAYISGGMASRGEAFMEALAAGLSGEERLDAQEAAGKCGRRVPDYGKALGFFRAVAAVSRDAFRQDRMRWFILDVLLKTNPPDLAEELARESALWNDPSYFSDLLEERISSLTADRRWNDLVRLRTALEGRAPRAVRAQLDYILARALQQRLIPRVPGKPDPVPEDLFRAARDTSPYGYYGVLASCFLGELPQPVLSMDAEQTAGPAAQPAGAPVAPAAKPASSLDPVIDGLVSFGLTGEAFDEIWDRREGLDDGLLLAYALRLAGAQDHRSALNLIGLLWRRRTLSADEMRVLYPRAFASLIEDISARSSFPNFLIYGLVREESYFDPDIVSGAGAAGLAQLMPATAGDMARSLRIDNPDLTDPETSLTLGVRYLEVLLARTGSLPKALLSYNAGLTRSRSWDRLNGGLATDLFVEAVPFEESRQYVRKILVSSIIYAYLYKNQDPRETVKYFYPDAFVAPTPRKGPLQPY
jgi:hypothetical protein